MAPYTGRQLQTLCHAKQGLLFPKGEVGSVELGSVEHFEASGPLTTHEELGVTDKGYEVPAKTVYALWCSYIPMFKLGRDGQKTKTLGVANKTRRGNVQDRIGKGMRRAALVWMATMKLPLPDKCYRIREGPAWYWKKDHPMLLPLTDSSEDWPTINWLQRAISCTLVEGGAEADAGDAGQAKHAESGEDEDATDEVMDDEGDSVGSESRGSEAEEESGVRGPHEEGVPGPHEEGVPGPHEEGPTRVPAPGFYRGADDLMRTLIAAVRSFTVVVCITL
jgi:hypothetical protein